MPRILVVEDETLIAILVADWLAELGYEIAGPVGTVAEALALVGGGELDGAILDVSLDGDDSFAVADALRARKIPFAFATGHGAGSVAERFKDATTLVKPFDFARVREAIAAMLARSVAASRTAG
jgi:CheY-like chemotaxis protein